MYSVQQSEGDKQDHFASEQLHDTHQSSDSPQNDPHEKLLSSVRLPERDLNHPVIRQLLYNRLQDVRDILHHGPYENGKPQVHPFRFVDSSGSMTAACSGLEGFLYTETQFRDLHGSDASIALLPHYKSYVDSVLKPYPWSFQVRQSLDSIIDTEAPDTQKFSQFFEVLHEFEDYLREEVKHLDQSSWIKQERIYQLFIRAYNLNGRRAAEGLPPHKHEDAFFAAFDADDASLIREQGFGSIWAMGAYQKGTTGIKGTSDGSPYSINMHEVDPALGSTEDARRHTDLCRKTELQSTFDLVLNHTSLDSRLLEHDPSLFVHQRTMPTDPQGYHHHISEQHGEFWIRFGGCWNDDLQGVAAWEDTLQLDLSNPRTRDVLIQETLHSIASYAPDCFRVDMAYQLLNAYISKNWNTELSHQLPEQEFLEELISAVKVEYPHVAFIAEGYAEWDTLSRCGFDLIYGLNHMPLPGGTLHTGWYESMKSRHPQTIQNAIKRAAFLQHQVGGSGQLQFVGQHDIPSPWTGLQEFAEGASVLTLLQPGSLLFYAGTEVYFEHPCDEDGKMITFNEPARISWETGSSEWSEFIGDCLRLQKELENTLGKHRMLPLYDGQIIPLSGYLLQSEEGDRNQAALVVSNPNSYDVSMRIEAPQFGLPQQDITLAPGESSVQYVTLNNPV